MSRKSRVCTDTASPHQCQGLPGQPLPSCRRWSILESKVISCTVTSCGTRTGTTPTASIQVVSNIAAGALRAAATGVARDQADATWWSGALCSPSRERRELQTGQDRAFTCTAIVDHIIPILASDTLRVRVDRLGAAGDNVAVGGLVTHYTSDERRWDHSCRAADLHNRWRRSRRNRQGTQYSQYQCRAGPVPRCT